MENPATWTEYHWAAHRGYMHQGTKDEKVAQIVEELRKKNVIADPVQVRMVMDEHEVSMQLAFIGSSFPAKLVTRLRLDDSSN